MIDALANPPCSATQKAGIARFAENYGWNAEWTGAQSVLTSALNSFRTTQANTLDRLKTYRDKMGAHSEHGFELDALPSIDAYEQCFAFAEGFYRTVMRECIDVSPALMGAKVGTSAIRVMRKLGLSEPVFNFKDEARS